MNIVNLFKKNKNIYENELLEINKEISKQNTQLNLINDRQKKFDHDKDIYSYINFWEDIWSKDGLLFQGSVWHFKLANLYVESKQYDKAINFLNELIIKKPEYYDKSQSFIQKIIQLQNEKKTTSSKSQNNTSNYQKNEYYSDYAHKGTEFEKKVVTFEERKKTAIPTKSGLYPAEVLLLYYVSLNTYPNPKNGYPGFWWFEYGIRYVEQYLSILEEDNFIKYDLYKNQLSKYTIPQLKKILLSKQLPTTGKKDDLILRIKDNLTEDDLKELALPLKYTLTEKGQKELSENAYVPYMHQTSTKTIENNPFGKDFTVWSMNKELAKTGLDWQILVKDYEDQQHHK